MSDRQRYTEETLRTLPLMEGRTVARVLRTGVFNPGLAEECVGFRMEFTDGTAVTLHTDFVADHDGQRVPVLDVARSTGLYPEF